MTYGKREVEQVQRDGTVVKDVDCSLSQRELQQAVMEHFPGTWVENGLLRGKYGTTQYSAFLRNVTYLGKPHPPFRKRIQIPKDFLELYQQGQQRGIEMLLIGVYTHGDVRLFCDFDLRQYVQRNLHNSSAHVHTSDLQGALQEGMMQRADVRGNIITVFDPAHVEDFLRWKFAAVPV